jgi:SAM-dependent methyltransferase
VGVADAYDDLAADYAWLFADEVVGGQAEFGATSPGNQPLLAAALGSLRPGAAVLDCSCGIGADAIALAGKGFAVTAADSNPGMVAETRRRSARYGVPLNVCQAQWHELPRRVPGIFDLAVCLGNSLVHAGSSAGLVLALRSMRQMLAEGGTVVVDSRNWELLYQQRRRIVPARRVVERDGVRCHSLYIWTIPADLAEPCRAEIVLLFEETRSGRISHRRHVLDFTPFRHEQLTEAMRLVGLDIRADSYRADSPFYAVAAVAG